MEQQVYRLRAHRIAVTPQRLAVLSVLRQRRDHPTAEAIFQEVRRQLPAISFNTVYKTLEIFCRKGLVLKVNPLHEVARYDGATGPHAHLICRQCHRIVDVDWAPSETISLPVAGLQGFKVEQPSVIFWGLCSQCQSAPKPTQES